MADTGCILNHTKRAVCRPRTPAARAANRRAGFIRPSQARTCGPGFFGRSARRFVGFSMKAERRERLRNDRKPMLSRRAGRAEPCSEKRTQSCDLCALRACRLPLAQLPSMSSTSSSSLTVASSNPSLHDKQDMVPAEKQPAPAGPPPRWEPGFSTGLAGRVKYFAPAWFAVTMGEEESCALSDPPVDDAFICRSSRHLCA